MNHIDYKNGNIDLKIESVEISARPRKLKAKWSTQAAVDLHNIFGRVFTCPCCGGVQFWTYHLDTKMFTRNPKGSEHGDTCSCSISCIPSFPPTVLDVMLASVEDDGRAREPASDGDVDPALTDPSHRVHHQD